MNADNSSELPGDIVDYLRQRQKQAKALCPKCVRRPQQTREGWCRACADEEARTRARRQAEVVERKRLRLAEVEAVVSRPYDKRSWRKTSKAVRARDRYCALCGTTADLTAHHLTPARLGLPPSESDSVALCRRCHGRLDGPKATRRRKR